MRPLLTKIFACLFLREQARSDCLAMVSWSGQPLVEMTNDYEQVQFHDQVFYVTSNSLLLQTLQREQETYEKMSLWTSDKVIEHFSTSIITGATADALALEKNIAWSLCTNVSEDELTKTVARALLLRREWLPVRTRGPAASRRIVLRYNAGGELAAFRLGCWFRIYTTGYTGRYWRSVVVDLRLCTISFAFISSGKA